MNERSATVADSPASAPRARPDSDAFLGYVLRPKQLRPGNQVRLLRGGRETFPAMLAAIDRAEHSVCLETYILRDDDTGQRFAEALGARARAGVAVRLIYDAVGGLSLSRAYLRGLRESGVEVLEFHPIKPWKGRFNLNQRDHRKILVVDHLVAFTGGINISDHYAAESDGGHGWHDAHCELRGPVVNDLERLFRRVWVREGGAFFHVPAYDSASEIEGGCLARVLDNRKGRRRRKIRRAYLHAINRARERIYIMNAYFLPDRGLRRALRRAVQRGARVRVIVPEKSDVAVALYASEYIYGKLIRAGIEFLIWPDKMMHAKIAVIDSAWSAIGSYNLDNRSLHYNLEVLVEILDPGFGALMNDHFERDAERCSLLTYESWQSRPWWKKLLSWMAFRFRRWL